MISKRLDEITEAVLNGLVAAAVPEKRTIDYKREIQQLNDAGRKELLADVSSFANTGGGDLIFGMTESEGVPTGVPGIQLSNPDQELLRLENIIRDGLEPRIRETAKAVPLANGNYVLVIRSEQSWYGPHRIVFQNNGRFWGRTSNGKYELDVTELRNAFLFSNTVTERIASFRSERVIALESGRLLVPLTPGPLLVLHCTPVESFSSKRSLDVMGLLSLPAMMRPMGRDSYGSVRVNFEGVICTAHGEIPAAYTQVFRNGVIEAVGEGFLSGFNAGLIPSVVYEGTLLKYLPNCFSILDHLGCRPPILVGISLIGVRAYRMSVDPRLQISLGLGDPINRDVLVLPEIVVEDVSEDPAVLLKPAFDMVWNACGYPSSRNFDATGKWKPQD